MQKLIVYLYLLLCLCPAGAFAEKLMISVSIAPQRYFVERIGGEYVDINVMVPAGADPHSFEPKPSQMKKISKSEIYFATGIDFEKSWLERFSAANKKLRIVHTDSGINKLTISENTHHASVHNESEADPHVWLSPRLVLYQSEIIMKSLKSADPAHGDIYQRNFNSFRQEIIEMDNSFKKMFLEIKNKKFIVLHPSWGYFAKEYGLEQIPIETEGKEPKPAELGEIIKIAISQKIKVVFVQPQFSPKAAKTISEAIGGSVIPLDPLSENWEKNIQSAAKNIADAMR